jgi:AsmA protein
MKGPLKWLAGIVGIIVLLIVSAAILLPIVIDPNDHKPEIIAQVKEQTGRDLRIDGDIALSVFPWIGVELGKVELGNAAGFDNPVFASTDKVSIRVKLLPLLSKRLEMDTVTIHGLTLNLARDARGRSNWDDLAKAGGDTGSADRPTSSGSPASPDASAAAALAIGGLDIKDANLSWNDASSGQRFKIDNLTIQTGAISAGEPVDLKLALDVQAGESDVSRHITVEGKLDYDAGNKSLLVEDLQFEAEDVKITGQLRVDNIDSAPTTMGTISIGEFNPKKLLGTFSEDALQTRDPNALTRVSLQVTIAGKPNQLTVKPLTIHLDDSTLNGEVAVSDIASQALRFELALDSIDVDRYLPPQKETTGDGAPVAATPGAAATAASTEVPNEALRRLDVVGKMTIGKLKVASLNLSDVDMSVKAKNGVIRLHPIDANLYSGTYRGNITVDVRGDSPRTTVDENLTGVLAGPLLQDLQGHDRILGKANVNIAMRSEGATADEVQRSLNGSATFAFTDGAINGVNVARMIREAYARIKGTKPPPEEVEQKTDFSELRGSMHVRNGVATNNDFTVRTPLLRINGKGTANLPAQTVDYRVAATIVKTLKGQGGEELKDLIGIPIPIHVTGNFTDPNYALDTDALAEALAKSKIQDVIDEKVGDDAVRGLLKGLFK